MHAPHDPNNPQRKVCIQYLRHLSVMALHHNTAFAGQAFEHTRSVSDIRNPQSQLLFRNICAIPRFPFQKHGIWQVAARFVRLPAPTRGSLPKIQ